MQTSKSYGAGKNNVEIKLELDDLEYVFADGHNLIINPEDVSENADDSNVLQIVYTDGSQAVVLQSGVKHYIQTLGGETYLLGNDPNNIQQLVINTEEQSEESNGGIEYVQNDENGETIVYKFAESESEISDSQPQAKRFKIGNTEYLTLDDTTDQLSESNQFSILDESNMSENSNFQYAILNDGKLRLQICEPNSIEVLNEDSIDQIQNNEAEVKLQDDTEEYVDVNDKIHEYVLVNTNLSSEEVRIGKTMTLDEYLNEINEIGDFENDQTNDSKDHRQQQSHNQYINKKLLIRKNANGKSLFGKILHIEPAKKAAAEEQKNCRLECPDKEIVAVNRNEMNLDVNQNQNDNADGEIDNDIHELGCDDAGQIVSVANVPVVEYNRDVTEDHINFLCKTLYGLVDMPTLRKKLVNHRLEIKLVEKKPSDENQELVKDIQFISGMLTLHDHSFVLDASTEQGSTTSLTIILSQDMNNQKVTKVIFHEKPVTCQLCNRSFQSLGVLNKHIQNCHSERALTCNVCQVKFNNHVLMNKHRKSSGHYFNCPFCSKRFTTQSNLKRHQYVHAQKTECTICKTRFANVSSLSKHLLTHTNIKTYPCDSCDKSFATFGDLGFHRKTHHTAKTCFCEICGREFSRHSNMQRHAEIHKGNGDLYKCGICECSYKFISSLTRHIVQIHMTQTA